MSDAIDDLFDIAVVISGDSDAQPPIEWVCKRFREKRVQVYIPALPNEQSVRRLDYYKKISVACGFLPLDQIPAHQLKGSVKKADGTFVCRPSEWASAKCL